MSGRPDVLVVGAGTTGLTLALQAAAHGAAVRIVDRRPGDSRPSRALVVHPRTLEVLAPLGVVDALLERSRDTSRVRLHLGRRDVEVRLGDIALPSTPFPRPVLLRQADVEAVLAAALSARGVEVERGTEVVDVDDSTAVLRRGSGTVRASGAWIAGCDGQASTVRRRAGIGWRGGGYRSEVVLADVELDGLAAADLHAVAGVEGLLFAFAIGEGTTWRLLATRPATGGSPAPGGTGPPVPLEELQQLVDATGLAVRVHSVAWSTRLRLQHRLAGRYRCGRVLLAGDAAHAHSPAAAQGMNTGILDAANLGWKLAHAATSADPELLVDSYETERRPVGRAVLALTHLVFWAEAATDPAAAFLRRRLVPLAARPLGSSAGTWLLTEGLHRVSGLPVTYRRSPLSVTGGRAPSGRPRPGDRVPDIAVTVDGRVRRLHTLLADPGVHVLAPPGSAAVAPAGGRRVHEVTGAAGTGVLAVRPDGHVGFRGHRDDTDGLAAWLATAGAGSPGPMQRRQGPPRFARGARTPDDSPGGDAT